jgi:hypothetical protein
MKKVFLSFIALTAMATLALAQQATATAPAAAAAPGSVPVAPMVVPSTVPTAEKTLVGVVKSVSTADAAKGTKSEIVVADESGKTTNILVKATTTLYDADGKAVMLDKIMANSKVSVVYTTTAEGVDEAKSVKVVK